jgi:hypothetical protein
MGVIVKMESISKLEYELIEYTKCGEEPLSVLIAGFMDEYGLDRLLRSLIHLVEINCLTCSKDYSKGRNTKVTIKDLTEYIEIRKANKENIKEYPECVEEYHFTATDKGINYLKEEDKPE